MTCSVLHVCSAGKMRGGRGGGGVTSRTPVSDAFKNVCFSNFYLFIYFIYFLYVYLTCGAKWLFYSSIDCRRGEPTAI